MKLKMRKYRNEEDYQHMRAFLQELFMLNERRLLSWSVVRLDYWRWHGINNLGDGRLEDDVILWETGDGQIAAMLNREGAGHAFLQVHPAFKSVALEDQMIIQAEERLRVQSGTGGTVVRVWTSADDSARINILQKRGYVHVGEADEHQWRRNLELPLPEGQPCQGYVLRPLAGQAELPSRSWASWRAFHPEQPDEKYDSWKWYLSIQAAPLYRPELDLVVIAPGGEVAAFTTVWYDEATLCGEFEPVGCMPEHQRKGLARALMCEGMRRLKKLGATQCVVTGGSGPANSLYQALLGPECDIYQPWERHWAA